MTTLYMVELSFPFPRERAGFDAFYAKHIGMLLSIDGFRCAQRFEATHEARAPLLAAYELDGPEVLSSPGYTSRAGPSSVSELYRPKMQNWDRNLLVGPALRLDVPMDGWLLVVDRIDPQSKPLPQGLRAFAPVGLDRTVVERGISIGGSGQAEVPAGQAGWVVRAMRPLHPRREPERR